MSGVSVRTLHFYDEISLLKPARYADNGYRLYDSEQLLLLQQILFFKELGFSLEQVREMMGGDHFSKIRALRAHRQVLEENIDKTKRLIQTIDATLDNLERGKPMKPKELYYGFDKNKQDEIDKYWMKKGGEHAKRLIEESKSNTKDWSRADFKSAEAEFDRLDKALTEKLIQNREADSTEVQKIVRDHFQLIERFYRPSGKIYSALGEMYVGNPDFRKRYDGYHPKLAEFWAEAMKIFALKNLEA